MYIDKKEVLRYLGYKNQFIDEDLDNIIDGCIKEIIAIARPLITYDIFNIEVLDEEVYLLDCHVVLKGKDITHHLRKSSKCAVLAVSAGISVDNKIRYLSKSDATKSIIFDSCASQAVESLCDIAENEIKKIAEDQGLDINYRYSPGYGDFPLNIQPDILKLLNAEKKIGLTCTENYILLPRKSVTAIIGFTEKGAKSQNIIKDQCERCSAYKNCSYRKDGVNCGL